MTQLFVAFNIKSLISYNSRLLIWWRTIDLLTMKFEFEYFFIFSFLYFHISIRRIDMWINRNRRRIVAIALITFDFENLLLLILFHISYQNLIVQLDRTAISEDVFDTIQFSMRRKSWTINSTKLMTKLMILFSNQLLHHEDHIHLTSNVSSIFQLVDIVLLRIFRVKFP